MIYDILPVNNYQGNGSATQFDFDFYIENENQLVVNLFDKDDIKTELTNGVDYQINEIKNKNGSYITFPIKGSRYSILSENQKISLELNLQVHQLTQYNNSSLLNMSTLENSFDYLTRLIQILKRKIELCVKVNECSNSTPENLMDSLMTSANSTKEYATEVLKSKNDIVALKETIEASSAKVFEIKDDVELKYDSIFLEMDNKSDLNLNNVIPSQEFKNQSISWGIPDYTAGVSLSTTAGSTFQATTAGIIIVHRQHTVEASNVNIEISIDGANVMGGSGFNAKSAHRSDYYIAPIDKDSVMKVESNKTDHSSIMFYPVKGANL